MRVVSSEVASNMGGLQHHISFSNANNPLLACVAFFPTDFRAKERLLAVYVLNQEVCL